MNEETNTMQDHQIRTVSPMSGYSQSILTITDPRKILYEMELKLRGLEETRKGFEKVADPLMNDEGINSVMSCVASVVNQNTVFSNLKERQVKGLMQLLIDNVTSDLMSNWSRYGIKADNRNTIRDTIMQTVVGPSYLCLLRPAEEGERAFWKGAIGEHVMHNQNSASKAGQSKWNIFGSNA